jgi:hypothetical protein
MKVIFTAATILFSASAFANPFDKFVGHYKVNGSPQITNESAKFCNRFDFKNVVRVRVERNSSGYQQTHLVYIENQTGWSVHPLTEFEYTDELKLGGSYARTTGTDYSATNEYGAWSTNPDKKETLIIQLDRTSFGLVFSMNEALYENSGLKAACHYQVKLVEGL